MKYMIPVWMVFLMFTSLAFAQERMVISADVANLRSGPDSKQEVLWQVEKYHPVLVVEKNKDWYKIKDFEGDMAWVHKSLVGNMNGVITIKDNCNVRSQPDSTGKILFTVERGVPFKVIKDKGEWIQIEHADGDIGWIHKSLVW